MLNDAIRALDDMTEVEWQELRVKLDKYQQLTTKEKIKYNQALQDSMPVEDELPPIDIHSGEILEERKRIAQEHDIPLEAVGAFRSDVVSSWIQYSFKTDTPGGYNG